MLEIKVTVSCPDLVLAATALSKVLKSASETPIGTREPGGGAAVEAPMPVNPIPVQTVPTFGTASPIPAPVPAPMAAAPNVPVAPPAVPTVPVAPPAPSVQAPSPVPTATAPAYTLDMIATAGTALIDAGQMNELLGLLGKYGVDSLTALDPAQYGAFATDLRAMGARI